MIKAEGNRMIEVSSKDLKLYTFGANLNPIYNIKEPELTEIKIPATDYQHALDRLEALVGRSRVPEFFWQDEENYE